ncbi:hypothetical protein CALCODRAFT_243762 [Calocera cornea HHB12733]|uniref:Uncharacterized protein n=1 Tax=Calocera cornea HHB12733 TaxID=1353952 RepID=A0A165GQU2_9BASI|nr:hypothetical protein CALCODRAFT_243762 [Calocera cornea HHB12733]
MTTTPPPATPPAEEMLVFDHISPPQDVPLDDYTYTKLPPIPILGLPIEDEEPSEAGEEGPHMKDILGHEMKRKELFYFVEMSDGRVDRMAVDDVQKHQALLRTYEMKSRTGKLRAFDPDNDQRLNPLKIKISLRKTQVQRSPSYEGPSGARSGASTLTSPPLSTPPSSALSEEDPDFDAEVSEDEDTVQPTRRSTRAAATDATRRIAARRPSPSPKKTRATSRQMQRTGQSTGSDYEGESEIDVESDSDMYAESPAPRHAKAKQLVKGRPPPNLELGDLYEMSKKTPSERELAKFDPLHAHRDTCEKCRQKPAHLIPKKRARKKGREPRGKYDESIVDDDHERSPEDLGGWLKCARCCLVAHWDCVSPTQKLEVMRAVRAKTGNSFWQGLPMTEMSAYLCGSCSKGAECMGCGKTVPEGVERTKDNAKTASSSRAETKTPAESRDKTPAPDEKSKPDANRGRSSTEPMDIDMPEGAGSPLTPDPDDLKDPSALIFRCTRCKRAAHYSCLANPPGALSLQDGAPLPLDELARHYQEDWECDQCDRWSFPVELILAWRPAPGVDAKVEARRFADHKARLQREYLVKWERRSFARAEWVPHAWLVAVSSAKLKNFLDGGRKIELLAEGGAVGFESSSSGASGPEPDALSRIPEAWKRIDRLLDVRFWKPPPPPKKPKPKPAPRRSKLKSKKRSAIVLSDSQDDISEFSDDIEEVDRNLDPDEPRIAVMREGVEPQEKDIEDAQTRLNRLRRQKGKQARLTEDDIKDLAWCYIKWEDLGYDQATWDSPYSPDGSRFEGMQRAFGIYLHGRDISHRPLTRTEIDQLDALYETEGKAKNITEQPEFAKGGSLFPFQLQGVSWLWRQWWEKRSAILADEMGLGKTVQVITFLNLIHTRFHVSPFLVVVPNSTITNWSREFAHWAPNMHVTPYFGEAASRKVIREFEVFHTGRADYNGESRKPEMRTDVIITTYETVTNGDRSVFNSVTRWEVLVVDESQKIKSDSSLIFKRLNQMNTAHRVLMTGTPLNNNIRELFNLMNFLDPETWNDLDRLEQEYAELDEEKIKKLHTELKPYFLRRIKEDELDLPARNEVIVPLSMSTLQKEVYRGLLSRNAELIGQIIGNISASTMKNAHIKKGNLNNLLMELRKCLQHPYLVSHDLEPKGISEAELHRALVEASTKLVFLKSMLRQLKDRGHRVLLFSQFVIVLDIVEDFLIGEGFKFMRLDGNTKQSDRQKGLDQFNQEGSEYFIYLLSTRAGGVGINLTSADTVIVFDPDFNPHMDHQAIARAHRIGQTKPVLVFKLMVKDSAEEKIVQAGKKKLVLDHLIVQKMDLEDEGMNDVQTILSFGARALFEEEAGKKIQDIVYSDQDIHNLIVKTEDDGKALTEKKSAESTKGKGLAFDFAKVWEARKGVLEELQDDSAPEQPGERLQDFWASVAKRAAAEEAERQSKIVLGRGGKRAAAVAVQQYYTEEEIKQKKKKAKDADKASETVHDHKVASPEDSGEGSDFVALSDDFVSDDDDIVALDGPGLLPDDVDIYLPSPEKPKRGRPKKGLVAQIADMAPQVHSVATLPPQASSASTTTAPRVTYGLPSNPYSRSAQQASIAPGSAVSPFFVQGMPSVLYPVQPWQVAQTVVAPPQMVHPHPMGRHPPPVPATSSYHPSKSVAEAGQIPTAAQHPNAWLHSAQTVQVRPQTTHTHLPSVARPSAPLKRPYKPDSNDTTEDEGLDGQCSVCKEVHEADECPKLEDVTTLEAIRERILASDEPDESRRKALVAINDLLVAARTKQSKAARTPSSLTNKRNPSATSSQAPEPSPPKIGPPSKRRKSTHTSTDSGTTRTGNQHIPPSGAPIRTSFSKVPTPPLVSRLPPTPGNGAASGERCPVCTEPMHNPASCQALPSSSALAIKRAIKKLSGDPQQLHFVDELKKLMLKRHGIPYTDSPPRTVSGPTRHGIQGVPVNAPLQSLGGASGPIRHGLHGVPVNAPLQSLGNGPGPSRHGSEPSRHGLHGTPVQTPLQPLGSPSSSGRSRVAAQNSVSLGLTGCLICHRSGHQTKDCPAVKYMDDAKLKSTAKALKRAQESHPAGEAIQGINALWHQRALLKAGARAQRKGLASASDASVAPEAEVIELSD